MGFIHVSCVTVSVGQIFVHSILMCSIDEQQADNTNKVSKTINYCHFSVAENTFSQFLIFVMVTYVTGCYRITPKRSGCKHLLFDSATIGYFCKIP